MIQFKAVIYRRNQDNDGETRLILDIPFSDVAEADKLSTLVKRVLKVTVEAEEG